MPYCMLITVHYNKVSHFFVFTFCLYCTVHLWLLRLLFHTYYDGTIKLSTKFSDASRRLCPTLFASSNCCNCFFHSWLLRVPCLPSVIAFLWVLNHCSFQGVQNPVYMPDRPHCPIFGHQDASSVCWPEPVESRISVVCMLGWDYDWWGTN